MKKKIAQRLRDKTIPSLLVPFHLHTQFSQKVGPILKARGFWTPGAEPELLPLITKRDLWAWPATLEFPSVGEVHKINVPPGYTKKLPRIYDARAFLDEGEWPESGEYTVDVTKVVLDHVLVRFSKSEPKKGGSATRDFIIFCTQELSVLAGQLPGFDCFIALNIWANELLPLHLLIQRPFQLTPVKNVDVQVFQEGVLSPGISCPCCKGKGKNECPKCTGEGRVECRACQGEPRSRCRACGGDGRVDCKKCSGSGKYTLRSGREVECNACSGSGNWECRACSGRGYHTCQCCGGSGDLLCKCCDGSGEVSCWACHGKGYRFVDFDLASGKFLHTPVSTEPHAGVDREEVGPGNLTLVNWLTLEAVEISAGARAYCQQFRNYDNGNLADQQARLGLVREHTRRLGLFKGLLEQLQELQDVRELRPIPFACASPSLGRKKGRVIIDFVLPKGRFQWAEDGLNPFPIGARVIFLTSANGRNGQRLSLRWAKEAKAPTDDILPDAVFVGVVPLAEDRVGLRISFPVNIDDSSIPESGYLKADIAPPSEKTQIRHLDLWTQPANWTNSVLQEIVLGHAVDTRPGTLSFLDTSVLDNASQSAAVRWGCSQVPLALVKGPPGTGKTTVIIEIIRQLATLRQKVLVCSQTHQAVRNVLERLDARPEIRMLRHGRDENLSEVERDYVAGGARQPSWHRTLEAAEVSLKKVQVEYDNQAGPLLLLERARDAAARLNETRTWFTEAYAQVDRDAALEQDRINAEAGKRAVHLRARSEHDLKRQQDRGSNLQVESVGLEEFSELWSRRSEKLPPCTDDDESVDPSEVICDLESPRESVPRKIREVKHLCLLHRARWQDLTSDVDQFARELAEIDSTRKLLGQEATAKRDLAVEAINQESRRRTAELQVRAKNEKQSANTELHSELERIRLRFAAELGPLETLIIEKARTAAPLQQSLRAAETTRDRYEQLYRQKTGRTPSTKETPIFLGKLVPDLLANADLLQAHFADSFKEANSLRSRLSPVEKQLADLQEERERLHQKKECEVRCAQDAHRKSVVALAENTDREDKRIRAESETRLAATNQAYSAPVEKIEAEWLLARGSKPEELSAIGELATWEKKVLDLVQERQLRLMGRVDNPGNLKNVELPLSPEALLPDCKASPAENQRRAVETRRELKRLSLVKRDIEIRFEEIKKQECSVRQQLDQNLQLVERWRTEECAASESRREEEATRLKAVCFQEENLCRLEQRKAIAIAASLNPGKTFEEEEPAETWEGLAAILRAPLAPLLRRLEFLQRWRKDLEVGEWEFEQLHWDQTDVFLATCVGVGSWRELVKRGRSAVDLVIIDEAAHATAPETIIPMLYGRRTLLIGDEMQLPPLNSYRLEMPEEDWLPEELQREASKTTVLPGRLPDDWLERSLFEWLYRTRPGVPRVMLKKQFRMHPAIADFIASVFYPEGLESGVKAENRTLQFAEFTRPICLISTSNARNNCEHIHTTQGNECAQSYSNPLEARLVERVVRKAAEHIIEPVSMGIITPYAPQKELIRRHLEKIRGHFGNLDLDIEDVGSVDSYQGSERDVIIVSLVRSPRHCDKCGGKRTAVLKPCPACKGRGYIGSGLRFVHDLRRLNVALSRAKKMLILIGNVNALTDPLFGGTSEGRQVLTQFASYIQDKGKVLHVWEDAHGD